MATVSVTNTTANLSGKTLAICEQIATITALWTFSRGASAPFAVASGAAEVANLKVSADNLSSGTVPTARLGSGSATSSTFLRGDSTWAAAAPAGLTSDGTNITQIQFPATQDPSGGANTLDDYEEGSWTPTDQSGAALSLTSTEGSYVKIGQMVYASVALTYPSTADGSTAKIGGLPYTVQNSTNDIWQGTVYSSQTNCNSVRALHNTTNVQFYLHSSATALTNANCTLAVIRFTLVYRATA